MEFHVIERFGHRLLADPAFHHFYAVLITHDARFLGASAQGVDQLGGPPMGMHVDHGSLLNLSSNGSIGKVAVCATLVASYRAIYSNRHGETSAFAQPCPSANRLGQAAGFCATARRSRARGSGVEFKTPCAG